MASRLLALGFACSIVGVASQTAANLLGCDNSKSAKDSKLKAVLSDVAKSSLCGDSPKIDFDNMLKRCTAFCEPKGIPILLGTEGTGFSQAEMDTFCMADLDSTDALAHKPGLLDECRFLSKALEAIKVAIKDFVGACRTVSFAQLEYKAKMLDKVKDLQAQMFSKKVQDEIKFARMDKKMEVFMRKLYVNMKDTMGRGLLNMDLEKHFKTLEEKANLLQSVMTNEMDNFKKYVETCDKLVLGTSSSGAYLLDICSVTSTECIESKWAQRVGCCCGIVPAAGGYEIGGKTKPSRRLMNQTAMETAEDMIAAAQKRVDEQLSRRLGVADGGLDVCGDAFESTQGTVDGMVHNIKQTNSGKKILDAFDASQKSQYSNFYNDCGSRRLEEEEEEKVEEHQIKEELTPNRHLQDEKVEEAQTKKEVKEEVVEQVQDNVADSAHLRGNVSSTERRLGPLWLTCNPPGSPSAGLKSAIKGDLKVAFSKLTETNICSDATWSPDGKVAAKKVDDSVLSQMCEDFCAPSSVPFVIGATTYGFNHSGMDELCLKPDQSKPTWFDEAQVEKCHDTGVIFNKLQSKSAVMISALDSLELSQILFEAKAVQAAANLNKILKERAPDVLKAASRPQRVPELKKLVKTALNEFMGSAVATDDVIVNSRTVKDAAEKLFAEMKTVMPQLKWFLANCNTILTGRGSQKEYLLDMCSQTSKECIEAEWGQHVGCCCGYNPVVSFGVESHGNTILGLDATDFKKDDSRRTRVGRGRRLADAGTSVSICAEARKYSSSKIAAYKSTLKENENFKKEEAA
jgi:hypothetical protein